MPGFPPELAACNGFEWDAGNATKNAELHQVSQAECEQPFFNRPAVVAPAYSAEEPRWLLLGASDAGRLLGIVLTVRGNLVRVISARDMSRQERRIYERAQEER